MPVCIRPRRLARLKGMDEKDYWLGFSVFPGIGPRRFQALYSYFGSAKAAWHASVADLLSIRLPPSLVTSFDTFRADFQCVRYRASLKELRVRTVTLLDDNYPHLLREIPDAPFLLYVRGDVPIPSQLMQKTVAIVGTRHMTYYGESVVKRIVPALVSQGCTIVSGLAYGVDAAAHWETIKSGGRTIAVLGSGIDIISPPSNARLYQEIWKTAGAIVSEMPLSHRPIRGLFPARNRIISGISLGTVVIEGAGESGSLITARCAAEQGRDVCAVPGPITSPYSVGPHRLLKSGAVLVERAEDILEALGIQTGPTEGQNQVRGDSQYEQQILDLLGSEHMHVNSIVEASGLTIAHVAAILTVLELKGIIKDYGDKMYGLS